jgi:rod shape-determining protein MreB
MGEVGAYVERVATALRDLIAEVPVELRQELRRDGALLCGGGAQIEGLAGALSAAAGLPVRVAKEPELAAVRGAGMAVDNLDMLKRNLMYIR